MWGLLRMCAACPTLRLNLKFELRPSWNNIHDTFPTGTARLQQYPEALCCVAVDQRQVIFSNHNQIREMSNFFEEILTTFIQAVIIRVNYS